VTISVEPHETTGEAEIRLTIAFPRGTIRVGAIFYRRDLPEFARSLKEFAAAPAGYAYIPDYEGFMQLSFYAVEGDETTIAMGGDMCEYLMDAPGQRSPMVESMNGHLSPWLLRVCFQAVIVPRRSVADLGEMLQAFAGGTA
jgi:hypothetical protein